MHMNSQLGALTKKEFRARVQLVRAQYVAARKAGLATRREQITAVRETRKMLRAGSTGAAGGNTVLPGSAIPQAGVPASDYATPPILGNGGGGFDYNAAAGAMPADATEKPLLSPGMIAALLAAGYFLLS